MEWMAAVALAAATMGEGVTGLVAKVAAAGSVATKVAASRVEGAGTAVAAVGPTAAASMAAVERAAERAVASAAKVTTAVAGRVEAVQGAVTRAVATAGADLLLTRRARNPRRNTTEDTLEGVRPRRRRTRPRCCKAIRSTPCKGAPSPPCTWGHRGTDNGGYILEAVPR